MSYSFFWILGLGVFMVMGGLLSLVLSHKPVLNMLLSLQFASLKMVLWLGLLVMSDLTSGGSMMYFYILVACEEALWLEVLINLVRCHGTDYFLSMNLIQCQYLVCWVVVW